MEGGRVGEIPASNKVAAAAAAEEKQKMKNVDWLGKNAMKIACTEMD